MGGGGGKWEGRGRGSARRSSLKGRERAFVSQTNIGTETGRNAYVGEASGRQGGTHMGFSERKHDFELNLAQGHLTTNLGLRHTITCVHLQNIIEVVSVRGQLSG